MWPPLNFLFSGFLCRSLPQEWNPQPFPTNRKLWVTIDWVRRWQTQSIFPLKNPRSPHILAGAVVSMATAPSLPSPFTSWVGGREGLGVGREEGEGYQACLHPAWSSWGNEGRKKGTERTRQGPHVVEADTGVTRELEGSCWLAVCFRAFLGRTGKSVLFRLLVCFLLDREPKQTYHATMLSHRMLYHAGGNLSRNKVGIVEYLLPGLPVTVILIA